MILTNSNQSCALKCPQIRSQSLNILNDINQIYQEKLSTAECTNPKNFKQLIDMILKKWIEDLLNQNVLLVKAVEFLENEATKKVQMVTDIINNKPKCSSLCSQTMETKCVNKSTEANCTGDTNVASKFSQEFQDMRCTLEKKLHDKQKELNSMRKMIVLLTEKCQNALCQTQFKDDIIKEMRKQLKNASNVSKFKNGVNCKEDSLSLDRSEILDLVGYTIDLQADRDAKSIEVAKCEQKMQSMKFDFDVLEGLYKNCYQEMIKQEKTINVLRQSYLDYNVERFSIKLDKTILESALKERDESLAFCKDIFAEFDTMKSELKEFAKSTINLDANNEVKYITSQLYNLQHVLESKDPLFSQQNLQAEENESFEKNKMHLKNNIRRLRSKLKHQKGIIKLNHVKTQTLKKLFVVKKKMVQEFSAENKKFKEKNNLLESELSLAKNQLLSMNSLLSEWKEKYISLSTQLEPLKNANSDKENQIKIKQEALLWLEFELNESSRKGSDICCESKQIFTGIKKWLYLIRKERRNLIFKIKDLQNINKILILQQNTSPSNTDYSLSGFNNSN